MKTKVKRRNRIFAEVKSATDIKNKQKKFRVNDELCTIYYLYYVYVFLMDF